MKRKKSTPGTIVNRRARYDYELGDNLIVGIELTGQETKSLRQGHAQLQGSYVTAKDNELWLINALISSGKTFVIPENEQTRSRKLLANRKEIDKLIAAKQQGSTIVPVQFMTTGRFVKLKISIAKGKKKYDKREAIKKREQTRSAQGF